MYVMSIETFTPGPKEENRKRFAKRDRQDRHHRGQENLATKEGRELAENKLAMYVIPRMNALTASQLDGMSQSQLITEANILLKKAGFDDTGRDILAMNDQDEADRHAEDGEDIETEAERDETTLDLGSAGMGYANSFDLANQLDMRKNRMHRNGPEAGVDAHYQGNSGDNEPLDASPLDGFSIKDRP